MVARFKKDKSKSKWQIGEDDETMFGKGYEMKLVSYLATKTKEHINLVLN